MALMKNSKRHKSHPKDASKKHLNISIKDRDRILIDLYACI